MQRVIFDRKMCVEVAGGDSELKKGGGLLSEFNTDIMEMIRKKSFGGFEGKLESGELVHFKCWVSKKK